MVDLRFSKTGLVSFAGGEAIEVTVVVVSGLGGAGEAGMVLSLFLAGSTLAGPAEEEAVGRWLLGVLCILLGRDPLVADLSPNFMGLVLFILPDVALGSALEVILSV